MSEWWLLATERKLIDRMSQHFQEMHLNAKFLNEHIDTDTILFGSM